MAEKIAAPKKSAKKIAKRKAKIPKITEDMFKAHFLKMDEESYVKWQKEWNEKNLEIKLDKQPDYDSWLNYFKELPPNTIKVLAKTGLNILSTEAYAALTRWHDILSNPHRIKDIHQSGLTNQSSRSKDYKSIVQLALENDRMGVLKATRDQIAEKLEKGSGARDTAALAREMTDIMTQIANLERKSGPRKGSVLEDLTSDMPDMKKRTRQKGSRSGSMKSRMTIDDLKG